jgi:hypothetical protein
MFRSYDHHQAENILLSSQWVISLNRRAASVDYAPSKSMQLTDVRHKEWKLLATIRVSGPRALRVI